MCKLGARLRELPPHLDGLPLKPEHFNLGHDLLCEQPSCNFNLTREDLQCRRQPLLGLPQHIEVLRQSANARLKDAGLGRNIVRRNLS
jgi:hypothetical protein